MDIIIVSVLGMTLWIFMLLLHNSWKENNNLKDEVRLHKQMEIAYAHTVTNLKNYNFELQVGLFKILYDHDRPKLLQLMNDIMANRDGVIGQEDAQSLTIIKEIVEGKKPTRNIIKDGNVIKIDFNKNNDK